MADRSYVPDAEARTLAWDNARRNGARQQFNPIRDVEVARAIRQHHDDPLGIDGDPVLTDEQIEAATRQTELVSMWSPLRFPPSVPVAGTQMYDAMAKAAAGLAASIQQVAATINATASDVQAMVDSLMAHLPGMSPQAAADMIGRLASAFSLLPDSGGLDHYGLTTALTRDEPPVDANRRRHGRAAVCPRHGPTRGGTCMRCRR